MSTNPTATPATDISPHTGPLASVPPQDTTGNVTQKLILFLVAAFLLRLFLDRFPS